MPEIKCSNIAFSYYNRKNQETSRVFTSFSCTFPSNKVTVLVGESGSGKSTLLHMISGLNENYLGNISFDNVDAKELTIRKRKISYITQNVVLYPNLTIFDNIAMPLKFDDDIETSEIYVRVRNIAKALKIEHCLTRKPKHLSYGQQQRVMIARAFVKDPEVVLLDEAFTGLDIQTKEDLIQFVKEWKEELNATLIVVTHDYREVLSLADQVLVLQEGKIVSTILKDDIKSSKDETIVALKRASVMEEIK